MDRPIPFITLTDESLKQRKEGRDDSKRKFVLHEEACKLIEGIKQPKIAVRNLTFAVTPAVRLDPLPSWNQSFH